MNMQEQMKEHLDGFEARRIQTEKLHLENLRHFDSIQLTLEKQNIVLDEMKRDGKETKEQAKMTNGRVGSLERWQNFVNGGLAVIVILLVPILLFLITANLNK